MLPVTSEVTGKAQQMPSSRFAAWRERWENDIPYVHEKILSDGAQRWEVRIDDRPAVPYPPPPPAPPFEPM
eukprot:tig00000681_g3112.t1